MLYQLLATSTTYYAIDSSREDLAGAIGALVTAMLLPIIAVIVLMIVAMWKIYTKAGREGWKAIIPFYNMYTITEIAGLNGWLFLLSFIPGVGTLIWSIMVAIKLAPAFGKGTGFAVGLILLSPIFYLILAFGDAKYTLGGGDTAKPAEDAPTSDANPTDAPTA